MCYTNPSNRNRHQAHHAQAHPGRSPDSSGRGGGARGGGARRHLIKCFKCGGSHSLSVCPHANPEGRERLFREKLGPRTNSNAGRGHRTPASPASSSQHANQASASTPPNSSPPTVEQANVARTTIGMGRPSRTSIAWATANYAATLPSNADPPSMPDLLQQLTTDDNSSCSSIDSMPMLLGRPSDIDDDELSCGSADPMPPLEPRPPPSSISWPTHAHLSRFLHPHAAYAASDADCTRADAPDMAIATNTILQAHDTIDDQPYFSLLQDWLIHSGASSHMTNNLTDLVLNIEESAAVVQVANRVLIPAQQRGTVQIRIQDLHDPHITCDILVHDVLYIPGLSRRLLSVDQWNAPAARYGSILNILPSAPSTATPASPTRSASPSHSLFSAT
jgi:hypothetical protein